MLHLYRRLLAARRSSPALALGDVELVPGTEDDDTLAWRRTLGDDERAVAVNFTAEPRTVSLPGDWVVELTSDAHGVEDVAWSGSLGPDEAVVLRPG